MCARSVSPRCIAAVVHIRANRKIDKKRRFVKCREVASAFWRWLRSSYGRRRPGVVTTVIPGFLPLFPYLLGPVCSTLSPAVAGIELGIGDTNAAYSRRILRLCPGAQWVLFREEFRGRRSRFALHTVVATGARDARW